MIDRRAFLISLGGVVAAPVFAQLSLPGIAKREEHWLAGDMPVAAASVAAVRPSKVALRIDGWESPSDAGTDVWVQINSSWRATWR